MPNKLPFDQFKKDMSVFLNFPSVEQALNSEVQSRVEIALTSSPFKGTNMSVLEFLSMNPTTEIESRLTTLLKFTDASKELLKRVMRAMFGSESFNRLATNPQALARISRFLENPDIEKNLIPAYPRSRFNLPNNWYLLLQNPMHLEQRIRSDILSWYSVQVGFALEKSVTEIVENQGYTWEKGPCPILDDKEVDVAAPSLQHPNILIFCTYQLTSASGQTSKAKEQEDYFHVVQKHNGSRRHRSNPPVKLINVVDGGGWIARANDLRRMYTNCDHCLAWKHLNLLPAILP